MPLDVAEIVKKVRRIQIVASRQVNDLLAGEYRSVFRGRGMEFDEVREYMPGDDVRDIDWNVTARTGRPHIKRYAEERELTILFLVDVSRSGLFGSQSGSKLDLVLEVAALLMLSAQKNNDKIGLVLFAEEVKAYYPPRKGRVASGRLIRELVAADPGEDAPTSGPGRKTDLSEVLRFISRVQRRRAVVFVISDFIDEGYERALQRASRRHDVIAVSIEDPREGSLPDVGFLALHDAESGQQLVIDSSDEAVRQAFSQRWQNAVTRRTRTFRRLAVDEVRIDAASGDYVEPLARFFEGRMSRN